MALGIKETKELIKFASDLGEGIGKSLEDNKWTIGDIYNFVPAAQSAFAGIGGVDQVLEELKDLDEAEKEELKDYVVEEFDIPQDEAEEYVEKAISIALDIWFFVKKFFVKEQPS